MCQWYVEALNRKLCVVVSSLSRQINLVILYNDFIARVIFINVNVLYTLSRKPVKYKSRGSMVFKDSCHVQDEEWRKLHVRIFTDIEIKKLRKIVSPINNNKQIQYTLHVLPLSTFISRLVHASLHPFLQIVHPQLSNPSASVAIKKKNQGDTFDFTRHPT